MAGSHRAGHQPSAKNPVKLPRLGAEVKYIWDLAVDPKGNLFAATGPAGQLWKVAPDGKRTLLLDSKHPHLLCAAGPPASPRPLYGEWPPASPTTRLKVPRRAKTVEPSDATRPVDVA